jgi:hypothetical protein
MCFLDNLLLKPLSFLKKRKGEIQERWKKYFLDNYGIYHNTEKSTLIEERWKKYFLDNYGAYRNADKLTHEEMLKVFWKILLDRHYDTSNFSGDTPIQEPAKQLDEDWYDLGGIFFITKVEETFGFPTQYITDKECEQIKTFGELADLVIKKAKEKKQKKPTTLS